MESKANPFERLVHALGRLPGIGERSALRLAFFILKNKPEFADDFARALQELHAKMRFCSVCQNMTEVDPCPLCQDPKRDSKMVLVIETPQDLLAIERLHEFKGLYHVLHGALSPINGVTPEDLKIKELLFRVQQQALEEVILATNANVEGEATGLYLYKILKPFDLRITRLPSGVPVGAGIEYLDPLTLQRALQTRHPF